MAGLPPPAGLNGGVGGMSGVPPAGGVPMLPGNDGLRESQVQSAVAFLSHPKVKGSSAVKRMEFLENKGLTTAEIAEALRRTNPSSEETRLVDAAAKAGTKASTAVSDTLPTTTSTGVTSSSAVTTTHTALPPSAPAAVSSSTRQGAAVPPQYYIPPSAAPVAHSIPLLFPYPVPGTVPLGNGFFAFPQHLDALRQMRHAPPARSGWGSYFAGFITLAAATMGVGWLAKRYLPTLHWEWQKRTQAADAGSDTASTGGVTIEEIKDEKSQGQRRGRDRRRPTTRGRLDSHDRSGNASHLSDDDDDDADDVDDRFGLSMLTDDLGGSGFGSKARGRRRGRGGRGGRASDTEQMLDALTVRVGDLDDRLNNQGRQTQRMVASMQSTLEEFTDNQVDQRSLKRLKNDIAELTDLLTATVKRLDALSTSTAHASTPTHQVGVSHGVSLPAPSSSSSSSSSASSSSSSSTGSFARPGNGSVVTANGVMGASSPMNGAPAMNGMHINTGPQTADKPLETISEDGKSPKKQEVDDAVATLMTSKVTPTELNQCIGCINFYINNILKHLDKPKYRKVQLTNGRYVQRVRNVPGAQEFLLAAGFELRGLFIEWVKPDDGTPEEREAIALLRYAISKLEEKSTPTSTPATKYAQPSPSSERNTVWSADVQRQQQRAQQLQQVSMQQQQHQQQQHPQPPQRQQEQQQPHQPPRQQKPWEVASTTPSTASKPLVPSSDRAVTANGSANSSHTDSAPAGGALKQMAPQTSLLAEAEQLNSSAASTTAAPDSNNSTEP